MKDIRRNKVRTSWSFRWTSWVNYVKIIRWINLKMFTLLLQKEKEKGLKKWNCTQLNFSTLKRFRNLSLNDFFDYYLLSYKLTYPIFKYKWAILLITKSLSKLHTLRLQSRNLLLLHKTALLQHVKINLNLNVYS